MTGLGTAGVLVLLGDPAGSKLEGRPRPWVGTRSRTGTPRLLAFNEADLRRFNALIEAVSP